MKRKLLFLTLVVCWAVSLFAFTSLEEKVKARLLVSKIPDEKVKQELLYNIAVGNISTLKEIKHAINGYIQQQQEIYYESLKNEESVESDLKKKLLDLIINHVCIGYSRVRKLM